MMKLLMLVAVAAPAVFCQTAAFHRDTFHGRRAFVLENDRMRVSTLPGGGFIGEIRLKSADPRKSVNPMRVPHYQTIDPFEYDVARHGQLYGTGMQRRLMSGYMGHFVCFPHFGPSSPAEFRLDYGQHGEALAVEWKIQNVDLRADGVTLRYGADLSKTQFRMERTITLPADETVGYVEETVENLVPYDRPVQWVQHVTFGPPFVALDKNFVDAPVASSGLRDRQSLQAGAWPEVTDADGRKTNLRAFSGRTGIWLLDRSRPRVYFTMYNPEFGVLIGYIFETAFNPWVLDWQENQHAMEKPWNGKVIARGVCIGDSPFAAGLRQAVERGTALGTPLYSWIEARQKRTQHYLFFLAEIPEGFQGVADVRAENGRITLVERGSGRTISIKSARQ